MQGTRTVTLILSFMLLAGEGCRPTTKQRKYHAFTGTAVEVDLKTGLVAVDRPNKRTGKIERFSARVTQATEIFVNGVSATLEDIRIGDFAVAIVYNADKESEDWIVTKVSIERDKSPLPDSSADSGSTSDSDGPK